MNGTLLCLLNVLFVVRGGGGGGGSGSTSLSLARRDKLRAVFRYKKIM